MTSHSWKPLHCLLLASCALGNGHCLQSNQRSLVQTQCAPGDKCDKTPADRVAEDNSGDQGLVPFPSSPREKTEGVQRNPTVAIDPPSGQYRKTQQGESDQATTSETFPNPSELQGLLQQARNQNLAKLQQQCLTLEIPQRQGQSCLQLAQQAVDSRRHGAYLEDYATGYQFARDRLKGSRDHEDTVQELSHEFARNLAIQSNRDLVLQHYEKAYDIGIIELNWSRDKREQRYDLHRLASFLSFSPKQAQDARRLRQCIEKRDTKRVSWKKLAVCVTEKT